MTPTNETGYLGIESLRDKLRVGLTVKVEPARLVLDTALTNATADTIHVFNVLWDYSPAGTIVGPDSPAYVCIKDGELRFARRPLPLPGRPVLVKINPYLTAIKPGGVLREQMFFDTPVQEYSCYSHRQVDSPVELVESSVARFEYGVAVGAIEGAFVPASIAGASQLINATKLQGILTIESEPVPCKVQVMRRSDAFQRF